MKRFLILFLTVSCLTLSINVQAQQELTADICIYGATSAGVMAAYSAKKLGKSVILIEPGTHTGGLTSGGLGFTDIGNKYAISGLSLDFYRRIGKHYGKFEQWIFEPHVAENLFREYLRRADIGVMYSHRVVNVNKSGTAIQSITVENSDRPQSATNRIIRAKAFIDCSYEGDLMAKAGVSYFVGREANAVYNETYNGVQLMDKHQFADGIDPYKIKGDPASGLLWGISPEPLQPNGTGDKKVQAYNFRLCLTDNPSNKISITRPEDYDSTRYELLLRVMEKEPNRPFNLIMKPDLMPNQKTDINNNGPFSTDMIGMNYDYPEASYERRKEIQKTHELYTKGLLYFIATDPRVPAHLQKEMRRWGYPKDEYVNNAHWSPQMYVREARRMTGAYVMTQSNCESKVIVNDGVGMAAYTMDSHNCQRIVIEKDGMKMVKNEGDVQVGGFPPYPISYRSIIPKETECTNLLVPVCLSASHIAYGSIRMEPVFMVMAQSAAFAAVQAIDTRQPVQQIDVQKLRDALRSNPLADGSDPDILIDNEDAERVKTNGQWTLSKAYGSFASSFLQNDSNLESEVRFYPRIKKKAGYKVYTYMSKGLFKSGKLEAVIADGKKKTAVSFDMKNFRVEGQTSGEWVYLGTFTFKKGDKPYIAITNKNAGGAVVADAVLLVPVNRDAK